MLTGVTSESTYGTYLVVKGVGGDRTDTSVTDYYRFRILSDSLVLRGNGKHPSSKLQSKAMTILYTPIFHSKFSIYIEHDVTSFLHFNKIKK